jgi:signal transduction histidine kinase
VSVVQGIATLRRWQASQPHWLDALLAVVVFVASVWGPLSGGGPHHGHHGAVLDVLTIGLLAVAAGSMIVRRSHPLGVWAVALVVAAVVIVHNGEPTAAVVPTFVTLYTVGTRAPLRTTVLVTLATAVAYAAAVTAANSAPGEHALSLLALTSAAAAVGVAVRSQRDAVEAAEARARQAEATREEEAERRVTDERLRIAQELHDVVAHHISVINVQAGVARHLLDEQPDQARAALGLVREAGRTVLAEMSTVLGLLRTGEDEAATQPAPGLDQVPALVETIGRAGLVTTWKVTGEPYRLTEMPDLTAYRIVQESLTNALKHGAGSADLLIDYRPRTVVVVVANPVGEGSATSSTGGHGLVGMRERIASMDGRFSAAPGPDGSFAVRAEIPRGRES